MAILYSRRTKSVHALENSRESALCVIHSREPVSRWPRRPQNVNHPRQFQELPGVVLCCFHDGRGRIKKIFEIFEICPFCALLRLFDRLQIDDLAAGPISILQILLLQFIRAFLLPKLRVGLQDHFLLVSIVHVVFHQKNARNRIYSSI